MGKEKKRLIKRIKDIDKRINTAKSFRQSVKDRSSFKIIDSIVSENQEFVDALKEKRHKQKITQMDAIKEVAEVIANKDRIFKLNDLKNIMVEAGFFKTPKNATGILITVIKRNVDFLEKVNPGVYRIIDTEEKEPQNSINTQQNTFFEEDKSKGGEENK